MTDMTAPTPAQEALAQDIATRHGGGAIAYQCALNGLTAVQQPETVKLRIMWGECPEEGQEPVEYSFGSEAEKQAFIQGVYASQGWGDYCIIHEGYRYDFAELGVVKIEP